MILRKSTKWKLAILVATMVAAMITDWNPILLVGVFTTMMFDKEWESLDKNDKI